jgi:hypothetical protein
MHITIRAPPSIVTSCANESAAPEIAVDQHDVRLDQRLVLPGSWDRACVRDRLDHGRCGRVACNPPA